MRRNRKAFPNIGGKAGNRKNGGQDIDKKGC